MSLTKYVSALLFLLASYSLVNYVAVAQPDAATQTPTAANETTIGQEAAVPASVPASVQTSVQTTAEQPFEDYEASEQISEDLSVAFPVDI